MSTIEEAREQARAAQEQISNRLIGSRLGLSSTREMDKDMLALSNSLDAISALLDATEPPSEDMGPAASCHLCVGAGGYEDYDGGWVGCSCQRTREPMRDADGDMISSGEHRKISMFGDSFFVCDTCTNVLGLNVRWDQASKREDHRVAIAAHGAKPSEDEREAMAYLITAHRFKERGLRGAIGEAEIAVARPLADFLTREGFQRHEQIEGPRPITDEMVEAARKGWQEAHGRTGPGTRMRAALEAAEEARR